MNDQNSEATGDSTRRRSFEHRERREWIRYPLRGARGILSWDEGDGPVSCDVSVINISGGGAALLADRVPAAGAALRLRLESCAAVREPMQAALVTTSTDIPGKHHVRIRFSSWIPLDAILELHQERRLWQRYPAREKRATLTWYEGQVEKTVPGELLNISGGGAAVITDVPPPGDQLVWIGLASESGAIDPVESRLVVYEIDSSGLKVARFMFVAPCPMELFELAVHGRR